MEDPDTSAITPLTDSQEILLSLLGIFSGCLSVAGSSTIVFKVTHNFHRSSPYDRLMLGLSSCDIVASVSFAVTPFLLPKESSQRAWASGNEVTANMLGFFFQFSFSAVLYNGLLSYYYLLTVKYGVKRRDFAQKYEKWIHFGILLFSLVTSTVGVVWGFYNEVEISQGSWVANWPDGCEATDSCKSQYIGLIFGGVPLIFTLISLVANNAIIYRHVRMQLGGEVEEEMKQNKSREKPATSAFLDEYHVPNSNRTICDQPSLSSSLASSSLERSSSKRSVTQGHNRHIREVASQGFLYVGTFLVAYTAGGILRTLEVLDYTAVDEGKLYWLLVLDAFLKPLQGFFNIFVYTRPNYYRFHENYPDRSCFWAIRQACFDPNIPRLPKTGRNKSDHRPDMRHSYGTRRQTFSSNLEVVKECSNEEEADDSKVGISLVVVGLSNSCDDISDIDYPNTSFGNTQGNGSYGVLEKDCQGEGIVQQKISHATIDCTSSSDDESLYLQSAARFLGDIALSSQDSSLLQVSIDGSRSKVSLDP